MNFHKSKQHVNHFQQSKKGKTNIPKTQTVHVKGNINGFKTCMFQNFYMNIQFDAEISFPEMYPVTFLYLFTKAIHAAFLYWKKIDNNLLQD